MVIPDPDVDFFLSRIPDHGCRGQKALDPGSRIPIRNTDVFFSFNINFCLWLEQFFVLFLSKGLGLAREKSDATLPVYALD
jgi:hypothetical protein